MITLNCTPLDREYVEEILDGEEMGTSFKLTGYIADYNLEKSILEVVVIIPENVCIVQACYSTTSKDNRELFELLEEFHCLYQDSVELKGFFNYTGVNVYFEYNQVCRCYFPQKITNYGHDTFSKDISYQTLEEIMYQEYIKEEQRKRSWRNKNV